MSGDVHFRFCENLRGQFLRTTRLLILCWLKSAVVNARRQSSRYLEGELRLTINQAKTYIVQSACGVNFLGVIIYSSYTRIQRAKLKSFKAKVKAMTLRNSPVNLVKVIGDLNLVLRGFANYFRIANCQSEYRHLTAWIRRRLRAIQLEPWKKPTRLHRRLRQLGYRGEFKAIRMSFWPNAASPLCHYALPNSHLHDDLGLFDLAAVPTGISVSV